MAGGNVSPRQKMINMMYLVLIALLAMNVSAEILKAFHLMEVSFEGTGSALQAKMKLAVQGIQAEVSKQGPKAKPYADRAAKAEEIVTELNSFLEKESQKIVKVAGGRKELAEGVKTSGKTEIANAGDTEGHANYFQSKKDGGQGQGEVVRKMIEQKRAELVMLLKENLGKDSSFRMDKAEYDDINNSSDLKTDPFKSDEGVDKTWENTILIEGPLAAVVTNLARLKNESVNMGNAVINKLKSGINATDMKFDKMVAMVNAPTSYVMSGSKYEADILLVASSSSTNYKIQLAGGGDIPVTDGKGKYTASANGAGSHNVSGSIIVPGKQPFPFKAEWTSFLPAATISATKMNVLYVGLPNPIEVSVPGVAPGNVTASMSGGSMSGKGGGKYVATVSGGREATVRASAKMPDGSSRSMGAVKFRIKRVPPPTAKLGSLSSGKASAGSVKAQTKLYVYLENFPYEGIKYSVNSCDVSVMYRNKAPVSKKAPGGQVGRLPVEPGCKVIVGGIRVTGPGRSNSLIPGAIVIDVTR